MSSGEEKIKSPLRKAMSEPEQEVRDYWFKGGEVKIGEQCDACGEKIDQEYTWHDFFGMSYTCATCYWSILEKEVAIAMKKFPELPNNKKTREYVFDTALNGLWDGCDEKGVEEVVFEYVDELTSPSSESVPSCWVSE